MEQGRKCGCMCHKLKGLMIVAIGIVFLLGGLDVLAPHTVNVIWPIIVILYGVKKMISGMCGCCSKENAVRTPTHTS